MADEIIEQLRKSILEYDTELAKSSAEKVVAERLDPLEALDTMTRAIRQVGDGFGKGELWLPDLLGAAQAMLSAMPTIEEEIKNRGGTRTTPGTVVIGTVSGDIHSIGKTMVAALLAAEGFVVHDLGVNVRPEKFMEAVTNLDADVLAMSALLTVTAPVQTEIIRMLESQGLRDRVKILVGGAAITRNFAESIGADGYDPTAPGAVKVARSLLGE